MDVDFAHRIGCRGNVPWGIEKITTLFIDGHSSTNPINFMKMGLVDVEIIGLTKITKNTHV